MSVPVSSSPSTNTRLLSLSPEAHRKIVQTLVVPSSMALSPNTSSKDLSPNTSEFAVAVPRYLSLRLAALHAVWYLFTGLTLLRIPLSSLAPPLITMLESVVSETKDSSEFLLEQLIPHSDVQLLSQLALHHLRHTFSSFVTELTTKKGGTKSSKKPTSSTTEQPQSEYTTPLIRIKSFCEFYSMNSCVDDEFSDAVLFFGRVEEQEMRHMEQVKNLFYKIRSTSIRPDEDPEKIATYEVVNNTLKILDNLLITNNLFLHSISFLLCDNTVTSFPNFCFAFSLTRSIT
jgi:hypothetical protein